MPIFVLNIKKITMTYIQRDLYNKIIENLLPNKVVILFGARRTGKTVLIKEVAKNFQGNIMQMNGEDFTSQSLLAEQSIANYKRLLNGIDLLIIDEAQHIQNIGAKLKLIVDEIPNIRVIASGSSSFDLRNKTGEPLVGRSKHVMLFPFSQSELSATENLLETHQKRDTRLIYGSYPETITLENDTQRAEYLRDIANDYLLKDILSIDGLRNTHKMRDLLRLIAFQMGSEVSYDELGKQLGMSKNTVETYLDLLAQVFIIRRLEGFARNLRKEIRKAGKWYFYDTGIRNAIINNFSALNLRTDVGALWENYLISERIKKISNDNQYAEYHFWRTYSNQEIDLIEERDGKISAFEFKWGDKQPKIPSAFAESYPDASYLVVNKNNYLDFI